MWCVAIQKIHYSLNKKWNKATIKENSRDTPNNAVTALNATCTVRCHYRILTQSNPLPIMLNILQPTFNKQAFFPRSPAKCAFPKRFLKRLLHSPYEGKFYLCPYFPRHILLHIFFVRVGKNDFCNVRTVGTEDLLLTHKKLSLPNYMRRLNMWPYLFFDTAHRSYTPS